MCFTAMAIGSVASSAIAASSAKKAASVQAEAADSANETQRYIFDRSVELTEPQREMGMNALSALSYEAGIGSKPQGYKGFQATPGYQFRLKEGQKSLERGAAARGLRLSGKTMKGFQRYGDGLAAEEYGTHRNALAALGGVGQTATNSQIASGQQYANAYGQNTLAAGNARASGYQGANNAIQGGFNNLFNVYGMKQAGFFE